MARPRHHRKQPIVACLAAVALLSGCSSDGNVTYREYGKILGQAFSSAFSKSSVPREAAASIPYASMGYRINDGDEAILVLATDSGGNQLWTSSAHIVFQTRDGRIIRTVGLPHDLGGMAAQRGENLTPPAAALKQPFLSTRLVDFPDLGAYGVTVSCSAVARRPERISILNQSISTMRVDETCEDKQGKWRFVDNYWLAPDTGFAWRSLQHVSPQGETVQTEIFRPPG